MTSTIRYAIGAAIILTLLSAFGLAYRAGYAAAEQKCDAAALRAQLETNRLDLAQARRRAEQADEQRKQIEADAAQTTGKIDDMERELAARDAQIAAVPAPAPEVAPAPVDGKCPAPVRVRPTGSYRATDDDIRRLRATGAD